MNSLICFMLCGIALILALSLVGDVAESQEVKKRLDRLIELAEKGLEDAKR